MRNVWQGLLPGARSRLAVVVIALGVGTISTSAVALAQVPPVRFDHAGTTTWVKPAGVQWALVRGVGGGGGGGAGGGCHDLGFGGQDNGGGGGGGAGALVGTQLVGPFDPKPASFSVIVGSGGDASRGIVATASRFGDLTFPPGEAGKPGAASPDGGGGAAGSAAGGAHGGAGGAGWGQVSTGEDQPGETGEGSTFASGGKGGARGVHLPEGSHREGGGGGGGGAALAAGGGGGKGSSDNDMPADGGKGSEGSGGGGGRGCGGGNRPGTKGGLGGDGEIVIVLVK